MVTQHKDSLTCPVRLQRESSHASLCALGAHLLRIDFFRPVIERVHLRQKVLRYTPTQKLLMIFVALLAGAKAIAHTDMTLRLDPALQRAFGLPGCAEQSVLADTLNAATDRDVADRRAAVETIFDRHGRAQRHAFRQDLLVLDIDLSPLPASAHAEGSERAYMGRRRSRTGRRLVRVRAAGYQETIWEAVRPGRTAESLPVVQEAVTQAERLLDLGGDSTAARAKRARTEIRLDSGWGSTMAINWLLGRSYQVTTKFKSSSRVRKLVRALDAPAWHPTTSAGREVAVVPYPVALARPTAQYAVRTPAKDSPDGYHYAVLVTSRTDLPTDGAVDRDDGRAAIEADLKSDQYGLGLVTIRKCKLAAPEVVVLLIQLAHNVLVWSRTWLAERAPRLAGLGIVRLVREVWALPGRVTLVGRQVRRVRLRAEHPRARDVCQGLRRLLPTSQIGLI